MLNWVTKDKKHLNRLCVGLCICVWQKPERDEWGSGVEALECALQLEKNVNQSLLDLHKVASDHNDPHVSAHMHMAKVANGTLLITFYILVNPHNVKMCFIYSNIRQALF